MGICKYTSSIGKAAGTSHTSIIMEVSVIRGSTVLFAIHQRFVCFFLLAYKNERLKCKIGYVMSTQFMYLLDYPI